MNTLRHTVRGWVRLLVTFVMAAGILTRAAIPMPMQSAGGPDAVLAGLGAALCHHDDSGAPDAPIRPGVCDHCDMCSVAVPLPLAPAAVPVPMMLAELVLPPTPNPVASPRAPPGRAHSPRAPPALV